MAATRPLAAPEPVAAERPADLLGVIRGRRSVRAFRPDPVPREVILRAVEAAGWAPSPHGTQPWRFVVLEDRDRRAQLADAMAETWREQLSLDSRDRAEIEHRVANSRDRLITPPLLVLLCRYLGDAHDYPDPDRRAAEADMATQSLGAAAQNFLLSLWADGLDAGWMCAPLFCPDLIVTTLGLDPALEPHAFFPVGYAARDPKRRPRRDPADLIAEWR
jgi:coenzyme F420-0:L-glutamate ligase / coenzyme F420-1:gamma-L-glutamate ligase